MSKKKKDPTPTAEAPVAVAESTRMPDPFTRMGLSEWFDRWPEMFASRWPEAFHGVPFVDDGFRMEQFVDEDGAMVVRGELPGLDPDEDVSITIDDDRLTISGERQEKTEEQTSDGFRSEFRYGSFRRTVHLPAGAKADAVKASYADGILEVRVPVDHASTKVTKVPIAKQ